MFRKVTITYKKSTKSFIVDEMSDWEKVAEFLIGKMKPGMVIALQGDLGAGKTTLTQYIAKQLGVAKRALSPTFALVRTYELRTPNSELRRLMHLDAYRIEDERELLPLELDEELEEQGTVMIVEWPEKIQSWIDKQKELFRVRIKV